MALEPILNDEQKPQVAEILARFDAVYQEHFLSVFRRKFGLPKPIDKESRLIQLFLDILEQKRADFTQSFRQLGQVDLSSEDYSQFWALESIKSHPNFTEFTTLYSRLLAESGQVESQRRALMNTTNPQYILRNWMAEYAIRKAQLDNDHEPTQHVLQILRKPFEIDDKAEALGYSKPPPSWACSLRVSCSS